jgi:poly-gamma-glutamate synthesis protein (capsule biosynthesis protein)
MSDERIGQREPGTFDGTGVTRRALLTKAGRAGLGVAAGVPLAGWLAGCSTQTGALSTPAPTTSTEATATPDTHPITIAITGDIMLGRSVNDQILATHDRFPFNNTADYLRGFDLTVGNLECVVSTLGKPEPKEFTFEANPAGFRRLVDAGFDIVSLANNHSGDYGKDAFTDMLRHLPEYEITPLGAGTNLATAHQPVIRTLRTTTVAFLAYCQIGPENFQATATTPGHAWLDPDLMRADIARVRHQADFVVVFTHWGIEYQPVESDQQQAMARLAIDAGADFVVGAHPHVIQPSEMYRGKPIVYSLGNFVFDLMNSEDVRHGNVLALTIQGSRLLDWQLRTARIGDFGQPAWI